MLHQLSWFYNSLEETAVQRIQLFADHAVENHPNGFVVCDSGGKDSNVIKELAYRSGIKFEILHNQTTADHPLTVRYVRQERERWEARGIRYTISPPTFKGERTSMWKMIPIKGPPLRHRRWCCEIFKERGTDHRFTMTGVRWDESNMRKRNRATYELPKTRRQRIKLNNDNDAARMLTERCAQNGQFILNPVIDWPNAAIWDYIREGGIVYNPLYDMGYSRVGCIGCPMNTTNAKELEANPKYKAMYIRAFQRYLDRIGPIVETDGIVMWRCGRDVYDWWLKRITGRYDPQQLVMDQYVEQLAQDD